VEDNCDALTFHLGMSNGMMNSSFLFRYGSIAISTALGGVYYFARNIAGRNDLNNIKDDVNDIKHDLRRMSGESLTI